MAQTVQEVYKGSPTKANIAGLQQRCPLCLLEPNCDNGKGAARHTVYFK